MRKVPGWFILLAGLLALAFPSLAAAQGCIGVPIGDGSFGIMGQFLTTDGGQGYGGAVTANLAGPLTLQGGYTLLDIDDVEESANRFSGRVAFELPNASFSVCPFAGAEYTKWSDTMTEGEVTVGVDISELVIPLGVGLGYTFPASPSLGITLYAMPQYLYFRDSISFEGALEGDIEEDSHEAGLDIGVTLGASSVFGGAGMKITSIEESDPVFTLSLGFAVGGAR